MQGYGYTGGVQTFVAPIDGTYQLEVWGAQGGSSVWYDMVIGGHNSSGSRAGGKGGYSKGTIDLQKGDTLYIGVGGCPGTVAISDRNGRRRAGTGYMGGYNGGGAGGNYNGGVAGAGGSGYIGGVANGSTQSGVREDNGYAIITLISV